MSHAGRKLWLYMEVMCTSLLAFVVAVRMLVKCVLPAPEKSIDGKIVVITNCSHPLISALAVELSLRYHCILACIDRSPEHCSNLALDIRLSGGADATRSYVWPRADRDASSLCSRIMRDYGQVDFLITGDELRRRRRRHGDLREAVDAIHQDLLTYFNLSLAFLPGMLARRSGHVVTIASAASERRAERWHQSAGGQMAESLLNDIQHSGCQVHLTRVKALAESTTALKWRHFTRADIVAEIISGVRKNKSVIQTPGLWLIIRNYVYSTLRSWNICY